MSEAAVLRRIGDLEQKHSELATTVWGDDRTRDNGIRSMVREHETRLDETEPIAKDAKACIDVHLKEHKQREEATNILKTAALQVRGAVAGSIISALAAVAVALISVLAK